MTTIWFDEALRQQWPRSLAQDWCRHYPHLFDQDDLRITRQQGQAHFYEWLAAIHVFQASGALTLVEKYLFEAAHPRKSGVLRCLLKPAQIAFLKSLPNQPPDLLVYTRALDRFWFVEVKGPTDRIRPVQLRTHEAIVRELGVAVEIVHVRRAKSAA